MIWTRNAGPDGPTGLTIKVEINSTARPPFGKGKEGCAFNANPLSPGLQICQLKNQDLHPCLPATHASHINSHTLFQKQSPLVSKVFFFLKVLHRTLRDECACCAHQVQSYLRFELRPGFPQ